MTFRPSAAAALLSMLAFGVPSSASAQIPDDAVPLPTVQSELNTFRAEYAEYYNKKDAKSLAGLYAPDAIITEADGTTYSGQAAILAAFTKLAPTFPHLVITSENVISFGATGIDVGTAKQHPASGGELTSRYLVVLRRKMGVWTIVRLSVVPVAPKKS
ncbi:MAG TPA: nuclear transport factor 2 family protein [Gemmatimonadales bacterium]|jgi:ketosteroid isomerase-like protein|nr:nuclear transport factor 2 family protein [Gemmatimonadales bacterium]